MNPKFTLVLTAIALGLPTAGFLVNAVTAGKLPRKVVTFLGPGVVLGAFAATLILLAELLAQPAAGRGITVFLWHWLNLSVGSSAGAVAKTGFNANFSIRIDPLSVLMMLVITGIGGLIHVYSVGYMADDPG
ncbi:MAG: hypothetical protein WA938_08345, partial [Candidatus Dormiibacterota bacterium]